MKQSVEKIFLDWSDVEAAVESLAIKIANSGLELAAIGGLPRGGLIPAVLLSHRTNTPFVSQVDGTEVSGNVLIVDDICDSGETLKQFKSQGNIYTATIHHKQSAVVEPDFYHSLAYENQWIVYPWENKDSDTVADYLKNK